eukprot:gene16730-18426_t
MAFFSFGQSLKRRLSRSKRSCNENDKKCNGCSPTYEVNLSHSSREEDEEFNMGFSPEIKSSERKEINTKLNLNEEGYSFDKASESIENLFVASSILRQKKKDVIVVKQFCNVAVGPDLCMKLKDKSVQTKADMKHRYTDTKDLETIGNSYNEQEENQVDMDVLTKVWKDEWLNSLNNNSNHFSLLKEIKNQNKSLARPKFLKCIDKKYQQQKYQQKENEEKLQNNKENDFEFSLSFVLDFLPDLSENRSLMANYMTRNLFNELKDIKTPTNGINIGKIIQQGIINSGDERCVGITACDVESYSYFADIFTPMIRELRPDFNPDKVLQKIELKSAEDRLASIGCIKNDFIFEMRITVKRSLANFPFTSHCNKDERRIVQTVLANACQNITGELEGNCWLLDRLCKEEKAFFKDEEKKFNNKLKSANWKSAGISRDWPDGRAIFKGGRQESFIVMINGEEHLTMCLSVYDGDLQPYISYELSTDNRRYSIPSIAVPCPPFHKYGIL